MTAGGFLVDTPGFSEVGLWGLPPTDLGNAFPEFTSFAEECRYADCLHDQEPACAVRDAVGHQRVDAQRYKSYLTLLGELQSAPKSWE